MFSKIISKYPSSDYRSRNFKGDWTKHYINSFFDVVSLKGVFNAKKELASYKDEHLPTHLYKFMPPTIYSLSSILQGTVHLSSPHTFNDPFDSYLGVDEEEYSKRYLLAELKRLGYVKNSVECEDGITQTEYWEIFNSRCAENGNWHIKSFWSVCEETIQLKSESFKSIFEDIRYCAFRTSSYKMNLLRDSSYRISSFSHFVDEDELMKNTTMWSHYADHHRGFCVKYSLDFVKSNYKDILLGGLFPVKYSSRTEEITAKQLLDIEINDGRAKVNDNIKKKIMKSLLTKSPLWNYEKEWRLILSEDECISVSEYNIPFPKIEAIYMGCRIDKSIEKTIVNIGNKLNIDIYRTHQSNNRFELTVSKVNVKGLVDDEYFEKLKILNSMEDRDYRNDIHSFICKCISEA